MVGIFNFENHKIAKTYVFHQEDCFYVSTVNIQSSCVEYPAIYAETLVWRFDDKKNQPIGDFIEQICGPMGCIKTHLDVVRFLREFGTHKEMTTSNLDFHKTLYLESEAENGLSF